MSIKIRPAEEGDLAAILAIYNDAVLTTTASWDYEPRTPEAHRRWFEEHQKSGLPVFVAVDDTGTVVAWGSLSKFRDRIGYKHTVEHSVYVVPDQHRQGIGRSMVLALIDAACSLGKHIIIGGVDASNKASVRLHETLGFEQVAHFKQVGYKFDRWLDLIFFQRILNQGNEPMSATITAERPDSPDAMTLITELEAVLEPLYPSESRHGLSVERLINEGVPFFVLRADGIAASCGGVKLFGTEYGEIKRMYVRPQFRGHGFAKQMLNHLSDYTAAQGVKLLRLETGIHQHEAIGLYERMGFHRVGPFGDYWDDPNSIFFEKSLV